MTVTGHLLSRAAGRPECELDRPREGPGPADDSAWPPCIAGTRDLATAGVSPQGAFCLLSGHVFYLMENKMKILINSSNTAPGADRCSGR